MALKIFALLVLLLTVNITNEYGNWRPYRRPKIMGDLIPLGALNPKRTRVQHKIIVYHNIFRAKVKPPASNMLKMKWHKGAAHSAQRWADECKVLIHDNRTGRYIHNYGSCGQNIFIATHKVPWLFAIKTWWLEKDDFTFGKPKNNLTIIGHYTQMVWAATHEVGCGVSKCFHQANNSTTRRVFYNYVCNYCPIGNRPGMLGRPYKVGKPCGKCKNHCNGKLCLNACPFANLWSNCEQLYKVHRYWLCHTDTPRGRQRVSYCKATCLCKRKGRIHD